MVEQKMEINYAFWLLKLNLSVLLVFTCDNQIHEQNHSIESS